MSTRKNVRLIVATVGLLSAIGALLWLVAFRNDSRTSLGPEQVASCGLAWRITESLNPSPVYDELHAVAAVSANELWAVGTHGAEQYAQTLTERWDGTHWSY